MSSFTSSPLSKPPSLQYSHSPGQSSQTSHPLPSPTSSPDSKPNDLDTGLGERGSETWWQPAEENRLIPNLAITQQHLDSLRRVQTTYNITLAPWPKQGDCWRIELIWDCDRLWGRFQIGFFEGVLLIDPVPIDGILDSSRKLPFLWRGIPTNMPYSFHTSSLATGEIEIKRSGIEGHFNTMHHPKLEFCGKPSRPNRVYHSFHSLFAGWNVCSLRTLINIWNELSSRGGLETTRLHPCRVNYVPLPPKGSQLLSPGLSKPGEDWMKNYEREISKSANDINGMNNNKGTKKV